MAIDVLFFGATAGVTGKRRLTLEMPHDHRASSIFDQVLAMYPGLASHRLLFSINQRYASGDEALSEGDELAIFTAVSGG